MRLKEYLLMEKNMGNKFIIITPEPLDSLMREGRANKFHFEGSFKNAELSIHLQNYDGLVRYRRGIGNFSATHSSYNYIYTFEKPINLFDVKNIKDVEYLIKHNGVIGKLVDYSMKEIKDFIDRYSTDFIEFYVDQKVFLKLFDGYIDRNNNPYAFWSKIKGNIYLADGNIKRFGEEDNFDINYDSIPQWVIDELNRYTDNAKKRLNKEVKKWCYENLPVKSKRLYRGMSIQFDDWGDYSEVSIDGINKILKRQMGTSLDGLRRMASVKLKRGKESSWSTTPQIAREFGNGMAMSSIGFLFTFDAPKDKIVIDFTELPVHIKKKLNRFHSQNEVIIDTGAIPATLNAIWIDKPFEKWLNANGYGFSAKKGVFKLR